MKRFYIQHYDAVEFWEAVVEIMGLSHHHVPPSPPQLPSFSSFKLDDSTDDDEDEEEDSECDESLFKVDDGAVGSAAKSKGKAQECADGTVSSKTDALIGAILEFLDTVDSVMKKGERAKSKQNG